MTIFLKGLLTLGLLVGSGGVVTGSYFFKEQLGLGNKRIEENSNSGVESGSGTKDTSKVDSNRNSNEHAAEKSSNGKEHQENSNGENSDSGSISTTDISRESSSSVNTTGHPENQTNLEDPSSNSDSPEIPKQS